MTPTILRSRNNRPAVLRGVMPSGAAAGSYELVYTASGRPFFSGQGFLSSDPNFVTTDGARLASLFDSAAASLGLSASSTGPGRLERVNLGTGLPASWRWTLPIRVTGSASDDTLRRAFARAIYWSSSWFIESGASRQPVAHDNSDGGSGLSANMTVGQNFHVAPRSGVQPGSVPGSSTPPPGPVVGDSMVPIGGPGQMSTADLLTSFCNKRPKDSEGALSGRDRQEYQAALTRLGFSTQGIDGVIGNNTRAAIQAFQRAQGIASQGQSGYGTIGPQTQAAIIRALCQGISPQPQTTTPVPTMPLPQPQPQPQPTTPARPSTTPSVPQTAQPLANTQPPAEAGMGAGPMLLLAAAGATAVYLITSKPKPGKGKVAR